MKMNYYILFRRKQCFFLPCYQRLYVCICILIVSTTFLVFSCSYAIRWNNREKEVDTAITGNEPTENTQRPSDKLFISVLVISYRNACQRIASLRCRSRTTLITCDDYKTFSHHTLNSSSCGSDSLAFVRRKLHSCRFPRSHIVVYYGKILI